MSELNPHSERLARDMLSRRGLAPHLIEQQIREYKEGAGHVQELLSHLSLMDSSDPTFVLARALMDVLQKLPHSDREEKIQLVAMMLFLTRDLP